MKFRRINFGLIAVAAIAATVTAGFVLKSTQAASCESVVITESDIARQPENTAPTRNWVLYTRNAGTGTFRVGPATPPAGVGSFETATPTGADKATLFNYDHVGTKLADINSLGYSTYQSSAANPIQVPSINIEIDYNGPDVAGGFATLVFEPIYNTVQGPIVPNTWQTWD